MAERLIVIGSGGHGKVVIEAARARSPGREIILLDDNPVAGREILGLSVSGGRDKLAEMLGVPVALGVGDNRARADLLQWLTDESRTVETVVHPAAVVGTTVQLGAGAFVAAGAVVIADAFIDAAAIINTAASVDHDCHIGAGAHIAPGVHLCGNVRIGARTLVGVGSCVRPGISVAAESIIGAGSVVVADIDEPGTYAGNPARRLR